MTDLHFWLSVAIMAIGTALLRFLPFIVFNGNRKTPPIIEKLSKTLPYAVMGMLVIYCLRSITTAGMEAAIAQLLGCFVVVVLHLWKRNTLISIIGGTGFYMILVQMVFF